MDKQKKEILTKIRKASKEEFFTVNTGGFVSLTQLQEKKILPGNNDEKCEVLRYFREKEYLKYENDTGPIQMLRITAKGIDALDPWWIRHEGVMLSAIIGIFGTLLGVIAGYLLSK